MAKARQINGMLIATGEPRSRPIPVASHIREQDLPPGVILTIAKLVPEAREALPDDEYEARIAEYQARAALRLPLPQFGSELPQVPQFDADDRSQLICWACACTGQRKGAMSVRPIETLSMKGREKRLAAIRKSGPEERWAARPFTTSSQNETYCPKCFKIWGWPDEFAAIIAAVEGVAEILNREAPGCERLARDRASNDRESADGSARGSAGRSRAAVDV